MQVLSIGQIVSMFDQEWKCVKIGNRKQEKANVGFVSTTNGTTLSLSQKEVEKILLG